MSRASALVSTLSGHVGGIKVGLEYFVAQGPDGVRRIFDCEFPPALFLDLKLHDIPNTVAGSVQAACALQPFMITIHSAGGPKMIQAAAHAAQNFSKDRPPRLIAVTVLTSLHATALRQIGVSVPLTEHVTQLARIAQDSGADGVVCSALEAPHVRAACGDDFCLVIPGIRPTWSLQNDQERTVTPNQARNAGAHYIVIGRPITNAPNPVQATKRLLEEFSASLLEQS